MADAIPELSLIVPTLNEAANLPELCRRVRDALADVAEYELILVDDGSTDGTAGVVESLRLDGHPITLIERGRAAEGGLGGAVLRGFAESRGRVLAVMDADLQHPPESLPRLLAAIRNGAELAVGSRYVGGGSVGETWGRLRRLNSRLATLLARPFAGRVRDPMSGFFALPRPVYERGRHLSPLGYKILLELMCKCRPRPVAEVPIHFAQRVAGDSKLTIKEQFRYLEHLSRLYDYAFPRFSPVAKFAVVVTLAWLAGAAAFAGLRGPLGEAGAVGIGYLLAILVAMGFHWRYVRTQRRFLVRRSPWRDFFTSTLAEWIAAVGTASYLQLRAPVAPAWEVFFVSFALATIVRYVLRKEFLLDVRGLRPEERLAAHLPRTGDPAAELNAALTDEASRGGPKGHE